MKINWRKISDALSSGGMSLIFPRPASPAQQQLIEHMAENAHNAWWQTYVELGYTSRRAAWGEEFMVPFEELSERGKEFDRMIMRAILKTFDELDLKVVPK